MSNPIIQLIGVNKIYLLGKTEVPALKDIDLTIHRGEYIAIVGPSGSGKSTLMNILGCLDTPTSGQYFLNHKEISTLTRRQLAQTRNKEIGFVFQSFNLLDYLTALENVALPLVYRNSPATWRRTQAQMMLEKVGLQTRAHHKPSELSGGQRQRVAIARALVTDSQIILADEPTGNLDSQVGEEIIQLFEQLHQQGKTIIIVTHDLAIAKRAQRMIKTYDGKIITST